MANWWDAYPEVKQPTKPVLPAEDPYAQYPEVESGIEIVPQYHVSSPSWFKKRGQEIAANPPKTPAAMQKAMDEAKWLGSPMGLASGAGRAIAQTALEGAQGASFGLADEALATLASPVTGYEPALEAIRGYRKEYQTLNPEAATVANISGSLLTPVGRMAKALKLVPGAAKAVGMIEKAVETGGAIAKPTAKVAQYVSRVAPVGAATGFGEAEGGLGERAQAAGIGGLLSTALGGQKAAKLIPAVAGGVLGYQLAPEGVVGKGTGIVTGGLGGFALQKTLPKAIQSFTTKPETRGGMAVAKELFGEAGIKTADELRGKLKDIAPEGLIADILPETSAALTSKMAGQGAIPKALQKRSGGQYDSFVDFFSKEISNEAPEFSRYMKQSATERSAAVKPVYKKAYKTAKDIDIMPLVRHINKSISDAPVGSEARVVLDKVKKSLYNEVGNPHTKLKALHRVEQIIDEDINKYARAGGKDAVVELSKIRSNLSDKLKEASPLFKEAQAVSANSFANERAYEIGTNLFKMSPEAIDDALKTVPKGAHPELMKGGMRAISDFLERSKSSTDIVTKLDRSRIKKIEALLPNEQAKAKFRKFLDKRETMAATERLNLRGSKTTPLAEAISRIETTTNPATQFTSLKKAEGFAGKLFKSPQQQAAMARIMSAPQGSKELESFLQNYENLAAGRGSKKSQAMANLLAKKIPGMEGMTFGKAGSAARRKAEQMAAMLIGHKVSENQNQ